MGCRELQVNDYFRMTDSVSGTDVPYYALADANKNITEYIDASGTIQAHYEYSPFGKITQQSGTMASDFDYRFSSEYADDETGLVYYNYRYYSPELGRWLSRDLIEEDGGFNLYAMVSNNPIDNWDRYGLWSFYKWLYTGGNASDESYNAALESFNNSFLLTSTVSVTFLTGTHQLTDATGIGCYQYCFTWSPTSLLGVGGSVGIGMPANSFFSYYVGFYHNLSISGGDGSGNVNFGFSLSLPAGVDFKIVCLKVNDKDEDNCPCPEPNNDNSTSAGFAGGLVKR